jgi:ureidoglycolate hydrolase
MIKLNTQSIAGGNFKRFGHAIIPVKPDFANEDFDWHEALAALHFGTVEIGLVRVRNNGDYRQKTLERHNKTKEIIMPLNDIVIVLAMGEAEKENDFAAFKVPIGTAVAINEGVWHQAPMCLPENKEAAAFIIYAEGTGDNDKEQFILSERGLAVEVNFE